MKIRSLVDIAVLAGAAAALLLAGARPTAAGDWPAEGPSLDGLSVGLGPAQLLPEELAQREAWEDFLMTAELVDQRQLTSREAVTQPWVLTLKKGDITHRAIWKNAEGRQGGFWEGWQYEIAAYRLDKHLGLGMVPPTVERRFQGNRGSCQYWVDDCISLRDKERKNIKVPSVKVFYWNRANYLQRLWDNLIANEDRHQNQILITKDWRMILIDHSRTFRTSARFTRQLVFSAKNPDGPKLMSELPRAVVDKVKALTFEVIKSVVGDYLTVDEINAVLIRRELILKEIDKLILAKGEGQVLY